MTGAEWKTEASKVKKIRLGVAREGQGSVGPKT